MIAREANATIYTMPDGDRRGLNEGVHCAVDGVIPVCAFISQKNVASITYEKAKETHLD